MEYKNLLPLFGSRTAIFRSPDLNIYTTEYAIVSHFAWLEVLSVYCSNIRTG